MSFKLHTQAVSAVVSDHLSNSAFYADVISGLSAREKMLPAKYFYDERGSKLFEQICETPEYYPTRTEVHILRGRARQIAALIGPQAHLVELGSGPSTKVRILLDAAPQLASYVPVDISSAYLVRTAYAVARDYPDLHVAPVSADFTTKFALPPLIGKGRVFGFFPGSTIGNFSPAEARALLRSFGATLGSGSGLLIGADLKKEREVLHAAYNDRAGITAAFNLNILQRINRELGAAFDLAAFAHQAIYNEPEGRVEMHLASLKAQSARVGAHTFEFSAGETICTEYSYKFTPDDFKKLAASAGYACRAAWTDPKSYFGVFYLTLDN